MREKGGGRSSNTRSWDDGLAALAVPFDHIVLSHQLSGSICGPRARCSGEGTRSEYARLSEADFRGANLKRAHLSEADFRGANFENADLSGVSSVTRSNFAGAKFTGTNFGNAKVWKANFKNATITDKTRMPLGWKCLVIR